MRLSLSLQTWKLVQLGLGLVLAGWIAACQNAPAPAPSPLPALTPTASASPSIRICDDGAEWPPYTYYQRVEGQKTAEVTGYAVEVIRAIFEPRGIAFQVELLPWSRCLAEVETGINYQMLLNASYSEERAQKYYLSRAFYTTNSYYFYSKRQHPTGLTVPDKASLQNYKVCGILGYNYTAYGVTEIDDIGVTNYAVLLSKLHAGRCDLFLEKLEIMAGFTVTGENYLADPDLGYAPVPETAPAPFYMMFPRTEQGLALRDLVDEGLAELEQTGSLQSLLKKYVP